MAIGLTAKQLARINGKTAPAQTTQTTQKAEPAAQTGRQAEPAAQTQTAKKEAAAVQSTQPGYTVTGSKATASGVYGAGAKDTVKASGVYGTSRDTIPAAKATGTNLYQQALARAAQKKAAATQTAGGTAASAAMSAAATTAKKGQTQQQAASAASGAVSTAELRGQAGTPSTAELRGQAETPSTAELRPATAAATTVKKGQAQQQAASAATSAAATTPKQKTTYIDKNGERKAGYTESPAAAGGTLYADQVNGSTQGTYQTTLYDRDGQKQTGWVINGKVYTDRYGRNELPGGWYYETNDGRTWYKQANNNSPDTMIASTNADDHYTYDAANTFEGKITNSTYGTTGTISGDMGEGKISVHDSRGNLVGYFTNDGAWHSNVGEGELSESYRAAGMDYLNANGIKLNGNGVIKLREGYDRDPVTSSAPDRYWRALQSGEGDAWLADNGYVTDENNVIHYVGGGSGSTAGSGTAKGKGSVSAALTGEWNPAREAAQTTTPAQTVTPAPAATPAQTVTPDPNAEVVTLPSVTEYNPIYFNPDGTVKKLPTWEEIQEAIHGDDTTGSERPADVTPSAEDTAAAAEAAAAEERARQIEEVTPQDNAQLRELQDQLTRVDELLEAAKASNDAAYAAQLEQMKLRIQQQITDLNDQYQGLNKQLYVDYMLHQRDLPQQLSAQGYTGGLRESSMLGLRSGYEGQIAENERQRLAGIRDLEAGGQDKELTLGIERLRANAEAEEQAYNRAQAIRAQILTQTNRIEDLARQDKDSARKEAQAQIDAYLSAGGTAEQIPATLLSISGYTAAYVTALASAYAQKQARAQADAILSAGGEVPADILAAAGYSTDYTDAFRRAEERKRAQQIEDRNAEWAHSDARQEADWAHSDARQEATWTHSDAREAAQWAHDDARQEANWAHSDKREDLQWDREDARYAQTYARSDADTAKQQAQAQVDAILAAGGTVPDALLAAAGYTTAYRDALTGAYTRNETDTRRKEAQAQVDAILKAGGTVPDELLAAAGYSTAYRDAITSASAKPTLTAAQVLSALKQGVRSEEVLSAYEYYYGEPYQEAGNQTPTYTYTPPATEPPATEEQDTSGAQSIDSITAEYQNMLDYADAYAQQEGLTPAEARARIVDYIASDALGRGLNEAEITEIARRLGI